MSQQHRAGFSKWSGPTRVVFGRGALARLRAEIDALPAYASAPKRLLIITTPGRRRDGEALATQLGDAAVLPIAAEHVPSGTVTEARAALEREGAGGIVAYGGGSAIGLAKALMLGPPPSPSPSRVLIAIPTTFSGSETTPIFGITDNAVKKTGRDERVRPSLILYDPALTTTLPRDVMMTSLWNALAHAVEALWLPNVDRLTLLGAEEAVRLLAKSARRLASDADPSSDARDDAFEGAFLAGSAFADVGAGLHHKLCHVLGGAFALPHAATHATLLPHVARFMSQSPAAGDAMLRLGRALGASARSLDDLAVSTGVPRSLRDPRVGLSASDEDLKRVVTTAVLASPPPSLRELDRSGLEALLLAASAAPSSRNTTMTAPSTLRAPDKLEHQPGFGGTHESEALPGALPRVQNAPRPPPYGLYPDLLSGTPFTVKNALNSRVWMYRVRASFSHGPFRPMPPSRFTSELADIEPNRTRWTPPPIPADPARVDFLDGLMTFGGDGDVTGRGPGYLVNMYAANADMIDRAFSSADGDLLIVPQHGTLDIRTELGFLRAAPGSVVVIPRAIKFAVGLPEGKGARGWMLEVFGPRLRLPERGLIGSNGLADARHFLAPVASWEDRVCPNGFEIVHKLGGKVFTATQEHSPFDVVAWHGVHVPYSYDLMLFNAMGSVTWDHVDPSIHTVLTAPLDDQGRAVVDFVAFRGRWDVAEHSFRPPFMHRNAATEVNGVVRATTIEHGYEPGCMFISPLLTSHGIATSGYDANLEMPDDKHEGPRRMPDTSLWIMFESALPFRPTTWARETDLVDKTFHQHFEGMKKRFDPTKP